MESYSLDTVYQVMTTWILAQSSTFSLSDSVVTMEGSQAGLGLHSDGVLSYLSIYSIPMLMHNATLTKV